MVQDENPARMPIYKLVRLRQHPSKTVLHPAPWDFQSPKPAREGIRHMPEVRMESPQHKVDASGRQVTVYYSPNVGQRGVRRGFMLDSTTESTDLSRTPRPKGQRHHPRSNSCSEVEAVARGRSVRPLPSTPCVPFHEPLVVRSLEVQDGRARGRGHSQRVLQSTVELAHLTPAQRWQAAQRGEAAAADGAAPRDVGVGGTASPGGIRRRAASAEPERCPFGTADNWDRNEPLRKHCVHYDTRQLLT
eukprot:EG_transcript_13876